MIATNAIPIHPSNVGQLRAWDGQEGAYWAARAAHFDRSVGAYHERFIEAAAIGAGEQVLDIGCGTGQTTRDAARLAAPGGAFGVDLSSAMIDYARRRAAAEGIANASFQQVDAQIHAFPRATFDVAISRTGAIFFGDLVAGLANVASALRPGGRLVLLAWQGLPRQEWMVEFSTALAAGRALPAPPAESPSPFSLAEPGRVRSVLADAGYTDIDLVDLRGGMWFGTDADDAYQFILGLLGWMVAGLDDAGTALALDTLRSTVAAHETADGVLYRSAAWLIRATRS